MMLRTYTRIMQVKVGMLNSCHLMKPVLGTLVNVRCLSYQQRLPRQPVPPLQQTCERYLSLLEPVVEAHELKRAKLLVEKFLEAGGVGEKLQKSLERKARSTDNWLTDYMVLVDYLDNRLPVVVYSNVSSVFPRMDFRDKQEQIRFAAKIIRAVLDFKTMVDNEMLPVDYLGGKPLCMKQYSQILSSCRIPGLDRDSFVFQSKTSCPSKQITVAHNSQFFMVDVYNSDGTPMTVHQLCVQLERICNCSPEANTEPVGILTTLNRDSWSKCYHRLIQDQTNKEALSAIQRSICVVCLDKAMPQVPDEMYYRRNGHQMLHGGGSQWNSGNRWFDKSVQFIIGEDGASGKNILHDCSDGIVAMALSDYVLAYIKELDIIESPVVPLPMPQKLHFNITPDIKKAIEEAKHSIDRLAEDLDISILSFNHFGKNVLKANKMSPDVFVQMALQLAYYRVHQQHCASYEAATMRMFKHGRVCDITSTSSASAAFVMAFDDPKKQKTEKSDLLRKAMEVHKWNTHMEISGQTLFGHFLGLQYQATEKNIPMPEIFTDTSFAKAFDYQLASSQDGMVFVLSAFKTSNKNHPAQLNQALKNALQDLRTILEN